MPLIIHPLGKESVDSEITNIAINDDGELVTWSTYNGFLYILEIENKYNLKPKTGKFGADMKVELENDGPVTIIIDTKNK